MRREQFALEVKTTVAAGKGQLVQDLSDKWADVTVAGTISIDLEGSMDGGLTYKSFANFTTTSTPVAVAPCYTHVRVNTKSVSGGTATVILAGRNERTE